MLSVSFAQAAEGHPKESAASKKIVTVCFACTSLFPPRFKEKHEKRESHLKKLSQLTEDTLLFKDVEIEITKNKKCPRCCVIFSHPEQLIKHTLFKPDCTKEPAPYKHKPSPDKPEITNTPEDRLPDDLKRKIAAFSKMGSLDKATSEHQQKRKKPEEKEEAHLSGLMLPTTEFLLDPYHDQLSEALFDFGQPDCMSAQPSSTQNQSFPVVDFYSRDFAQAAEDNPKESASSKKIVTVCFACKKFFAPTFKEEHEKTKYHLKKLSELTEDTLLFKDVEIKITKNKKCPRCRVIFSRPEKLIKHTLFKPAYCTEEPVPAPAPYKHKPSPDQPEITNTPEDRLKESASSKKIVTVCFACRSCFAPKIKEEHEKKKYHLKKISELTEDTLLFKDVEIEITKNKKCPRCRVIFSRPEKLIKHTLFRPPYCTKEPVPVPCKHKPSPDKPEITNTPEDRLPDDLKRKIAAFSKMGSLDKATSEHQQKRKKPEEKEEAHLPNLMLPTTEFLLDPYHDHLSDPLFDFGQPDCMPAQPSSTENQSFPVVNLDSTDPLYLPEPFDPDQNFFE